MNVVFNFHHKMNIGILRLWVLFSFAIMICCSEDSDALEKLILKKIDESFSYDYPKNSDEYFENLDGGDVYEYGEFDFIIVGSGSTGSVLSNRLSFIRSWKILVLEAGGQENLLTDIPSMYQFLLRSKYNWGYNTTSQKYGCKGMINNECSYPRGKILGGSSSINGLLYTRGNPEDYDAWKKLGIIGWSYDEVEPYFKKMENAQFRAENLGHSGKLYVNFSTPFVPLQDTFFEAFSEFGIEKTQYNSRKQLGTSKVQSNIKRGRRVSGSSAYIKPALHRKNLNVTLNALVTKVLIDENTKTALGVRFVRNGKTYDAFARKEVILSAGGVNSPQILMLSGVGPRNLLNKHNIPQIVDLPVGEKLLDQIAFNLQFSSNYTQNLIPLSEQIREFLNGEGLLTAPFNGKSLSFVSENGKGRPTVEYVLLPPTGGQNYLERSSASPYIQSVNDEYMSKIDPNHFFSFTIILLHPKSIGKLLIKSSNPADFPLIDSRIFEAEEDIESLYKAIQFAINITKTEPFKKINATVFAPIPPCYELELYSKEYWHCAIQYMALPAYHTMGTTSMGVDPKSSVVNSDLKVHGIEKLRVADCGVIPASISGHTNGPAFMIGEKLSSMIKKEYKSNN